VTISVATTGGAAPIANNDTFTVAANYTLQVDAVGVLEGDTDADNDPLLVANPGTITTTNNGTVTLNANGSFSYQPVANFIGTDSFTYRATDGINPSNTATVTITVGATNNAPTIEAPGSQFGAVLDQALAIPPIVISDIDAGSNIIQVSLSTQQISTGSAPQPIGLINLGVTTGITFTSGTNNSGSFVIQGTLANLNAALASLTYTPDLETFPDDSAIENYPIIIGVNDRGFTGGTTSTPQSSSASVIVVRSNDEQQAITDINTFPTTGSGTSSSSPQNLTAVGNLLYFTANDGNNGVELWQSDGTEAGTTIVADLNQVPDSTGSAFSGNANLTVIGTTLYFTANDGNFGSELWRLNQGETTPTRLTNINTAGNSNPSDLTVFNGTLFFLATNDTSITNIYRIDGTTPTIVGTGYTSPSQLTVVGNTLYFTANGDGELWRSNGTTTTLVRAISPSADISNLVAVGNQVYFTATDTNGTELWRSDGTAAGTTRVSDLNPGAGSSNPNNLVNLNGALYFVASNGTNNGLYRTTTAGGVEAVPGTSLPAGSQIDSLTVVGSRLFFVVGTTAEPNQALWTATSAGITGQIRDINPFGSDDVRSLTNVNGRLFFVASDNNPANNPNVRIWQTDGTSAGTSPVSQNDFNGVAPANLTAVGSEVFFTAEAFDVSSNDSLGVELFKLD
jgi:ELWxxDGT repeat protein/VCBS repeat-containing protein